MNEPIHQFLFIVIAWLLAALTQFRYSSLVLTVFGALFVFTFSPWAIVFIAFMSLQASILVVISQRLERSNLWRKYASYLLLINLFFVDFQSLIFLEPISTLAISFSTIRIFMTSRNILVERKVKSHRNLWWIWVAAFYLPSIVIGPVFSGLIIRDQIAKPQDRTPNIRDHRMILLGLVLCTLLALGLSELAERAKSLHPALFWIVTPVLRFLQLFSSFWGQSLIAEHSSRFFGFYLPVNFDHPWKAKNIKEFWSRWHRSMADFVMQYIFLPLSLKGVNAKIATLLAFVFMGLWHNISLGYFIWGVAHGTAMALWPTNPTTRIAKILFASRFSQLLTWVIIIGLSYIANYSPLSW